MVSQMVFVMVCGAEGMRELSTFPKSTRTIPIVIRAATIIISMIELRISYPCRAVLLCAI